MKPAGSYFCSCNQSAVGPVDRSREESLRHDFEKAARVDLVFAHESDGLAQAFDHRCDEEVSAQLHEVGLGRIFAQEEGALADSVEQRLDVLDGFFSPAGTTKSFAAAAASGRPKTGAAT